MGLEHKGPFIANLGQPVEVTRELIELAVAATQLVLAVAETLYRGPEDS